MCGKCQEMYLLCVDRWEGSETKETSRGLFRVLVVPGLIVRNAERGWRQYRGQR